MRIAWLVFVLALAVSSCRQPGFRPDVGIVTGAEHDSLLFSMGYTLRVESIARSLSPRTVSEEEFELWLSHAKETKTRVYATNIFIPGEFKSVGPEADPEAILAYAEIVFTRCRRAGVTLIVWGSGGSRRIPDGFDPIKAREQFVDLARQLANLAAKYSITLALENLNHEECNFITTLSEARSIVWEVSHPNLRLCADVYHMLKEDEPPAAIEAAGALIVHADLAEGTDRSPPGTHNGDFRPYLRALRNAGFKGNIMLECRWKNLSAEGGPARSYLLGQLSEVYHE